MDFLWGVSDQWILTCIYAITKILKYEPDVTFARLIDVYVDTRGKDLGEHTCQAIVRHVKILDGAGEGGEEGAYGATKIGSIIRLYNLVFVPVMKTHLLKSKSLKRNRTVLKEAMKKAKAAKAALPNTVTPTGEKSSLPVSIQRGNVSVQLTLRDNKEDLTDVASYSFPGDNVVGKSTYLQLGRPASSGVSL